MYSFVITTSKGLDDLLAQEIAGICPHLSLKTKPGQVIFDGELEDAYRLCLWSRLANRVLLQLAEGEVKDAEALYSLASSVNWTSHFSVEQRFVVDFIGTSKAINNSQFGALKVKDAVVDQFMELFEKRPDVSKELPDIRIQCRLWRDRVGIFIDLSGQSLHQRHYRAKAGEAPVKEHIAAAMLIRSGWAANKDKPLADPMCGAGTIAIEAALMASNQAPGLKRPNWGFSRWKKHQPSLWQQLVETAKAAIKTPEAPIFANDIDAKMVNIARHNADAAGVADLIEFNQGDACDWQLNCAPGYLVSNPPYGERLGELTALLPLFSRFGEHLKRHFANWHLSLLTSNRDLLKQLKLMAGKEYQLMNGALACQLVNFILDEKNCEIRDSAPAGQDFANRLNKNLARLKGWLKQQDTDCYRLYDADLPEYNLALDRYGDYVVVQEYAPPKDIPEAKAKKRLMDALSVMPQVLNVVHDKIVLKVRQQQKGKGQYERMAQRGEFIQVRENGARFYVNLWDYLDTGLFLDHRITRQMVQRSSKGLDVLNLFSYTGSVSVHAAIGGARSVTTVDMSRTYLEWAKRNFTLNGLSNLYQYRFIQADCLEWLREHQQKYDLIFIDPPSFSNSKRMENTWDVQRDHIALLSDANRCLKPGGKIIFSNNLRSFKLDDAGIADLGLKVENISAKTLPEDFKRNPKIHHCFVLTHE
ncbi:bifunctional 23S rRNA (guanine(2069)-N(7))-methyltransferase RlmK/23S rRNA (guanine(2445)-N(2))-methyltransferase RlmL [Aliiglaciecola sp. CAU 1673]|uniref:bifunctional 23S rRNA (guanine(2069)-N(7))-methyltransferase RlmK/23S rRNA (guanine(2445)-N(2))-methyltransferase RlmL n=1 Tax=Aliiglaciecola sp. CAU 1673 TaxID=3032595 RepID=UPI0023DA055C|nr:bifunctional 23S rRNA (guanine(2069)-N(7))-methyltransferase RlmK/23S rRNA (guanine(2445)-N(2))-methyltransferase RlmL [Aliiglaciecola sp. CAU 1673]MDF2177524.1 bifunctional 23S rRNA (guanine(2069)-N(7))-methyltransferase RlmK/23S rRNA (guanine(2445)-N(2))-methyltransferase RlmL [Aliiglaciecola sp. CAU 1673]